MSDHAEPTTASRGDRLHGGLARMHDALGGEPSQAPPTEPRTIAARLPEPRHDHVEGFLVKARILQPVPGWPWRWMARPLKDAESFQPKSAMGR